MSKLDEILNDDWLTCEIIKTAENEARRVDLIKWTHDKTYSVAEIRKDINELEITDFEASSYDEAYNFFCMKCDGIAANA